MIIHNMEQQTPEWFEVRKLKMTASHAQAIGNNGKGLESYTDELLADYLSSATKENFSNEHTERGNELEGTARGIYEFENDVEVTEVGFIEHSEYVGCSPDGLVGEDGGIEIKCISDLPFFKHLMNGESEIESKYIWQIQMCLLITQRKWWDLLIYNPNFKKSMYIKRYTPDKEMQDKLILGFEKGEKIIKEKLEKYNK